MKEPKPTANSQPECPIATYRKTLELVRVETESAMQKNLRRLEELVQRINDQHQD